MTVMALALFSGGLDSLLACKVVEKAGVPVQGVRFVTPFFGYDLLEQEVAYRLRIKEKYGIDVLLRDVSEQYLRMLAKPRHGYGKNFNPCVDCKIMLLRQATAMMAEIGASFIITGEVLGQRPMSQRRDTLRVIERDSGAERFLVRPLCAQHLPPSPAELSGLIDRDKLLAFHGRGRQSQIALAGQFGITDYQSPSGGCSLTDPNLAVRVARFYEKRGMATVNEARLLLVGRHFNLPSGGWLVVGRNEKENIFLEKLVQKDDRTLINTSRPGPLGLLRNSDSDEETSLAASIVVRYSKKDPQATAADVALARAGTISLLHAEPLADEMLERFRG